MGGFFRFGGAEGRVECGQDPGCFGGGRGESSPWSGGLECGRVALAGRIRKRLGGGTKVGRGDDFEGSGPGFVRKMEDVESGLSLKKWVGGFFAANGGGGAVAGIDDGLRRKR